MRKYLFLLIAFAAVLTTLPAAAADAPGEPGVQNICYAEKDDCGTGCPTISCEGTYSCLVGSNYVECDGTRTYCPLSCGGCSATVTCDNGQILRCSGDDYCHEQDRCSVTCDGVTEMCPNANEPGGPICFEPA